MPAYLATASGTGGGIDPAWIAACAPLALAALGFAGWLTRRLWRLVAQATRFLDVFFGTPAHDGVEARPGVMARLGTVEELVHRILAETTPNGGGSMRDEVAMTARDVAVIKTEQAAVRARLEMLQGQQPRHGESR